MEFVVFVCALLDCCFWFTWCEKLTFRFDRLYSDVKTSIAWNMRMGSAPLRVASCGAPQNGTCLSVKSGKQMIHLLYFHEWRLNRTISHHIHRGDTFHVANESWEMLGYLSFGYWGFDRPKTHINRRLRKSKGTLLELLPGQGRVLPPGADAPAAGPTAEHNAGNQAKPFNWRTNNMHQKITENQNTSKIFD